MRIAFDWQIFCVQSYGGVSRYFARLLEHLRARGEDGRIFAPVHRNRYVARLPSAAVMGIGLARYPPKTTRAFLALNSVVAKRALARWRPEVVHETYFNRRPFTAAGSASIVTVHDMIHERFPGDFPRSDPTSRLKRAAVARAAQVICVSESTRRDLLELFDVDESKVTVVHLGFDRMSRGEAPARGESGRPYLLYVGQRAGYKNFAGLVAAVGSSRALRDELDIVAFGGGPFAAPELQLIAAAGLGRDQVRQVAGDDELLGRTYAAASALVYPSLYEGFGLPPLEAMAHDCPVIASGTSSMPEIIGDAGELFDPSSPAEIAGAIQRVIYSPSRIHELVRNGRRRLESFTWDSCAAQTLHVYRQAAAAR
jgi:glycosyltransferase involved in cell wall biosynthesis